MNVAARRPARWSRWALITVCAMATLASVHFGLRTVWSLQLMRSAQAIGAPTLSNLRAWMTLRYVATAWGAPEATLVARLGLPADTDPGIDLKTLAEREGVARRDYVRRVQAAVAELAPVQRTAAAESGTGWLTTFGERFLAALLAYGLPVLGLTLLLGAIGAPLPTGLMAALAGSMVAQGQMSGLWAGMVAVTASVAGDVAGYGLGRWAGESFMARWGGWIGATPARRARIAGFLARYEVPTLLLSRTLVSGLGSVVNLLAGIGRHALGRFLALTILGRLLWTSAYLGLGWAVGGELDAATGFLRNLAGLLVALALLTGAALAWRRRATT